ncbi:hypothetical protein Tco_0404041 [Tanacetum coccineum]
MALKQMSQAAELPSSCRRSGEDESSCADRAPGTSGAQSVAVVQAMQEEEAIELAIELLRWFAKMENVGTRITWPTVKDCVPRREAGMGGLQSGHCLCLKDVVHRRVAPLCGDWEGVHVDPAKIEAVKNWPVSKSPTEEKVREMPLRVRYLMMSTYTDLSERILKGPIRTAVCENENWRNKKNVKAEEKENSGHVCWKPIFEIHLDGDLVFENRCVVALFGGLLKDLIMHEDHK